MIPNSLLPRKGENEKIFTRLGEVVFRSWSSELELEVRDQGSGVRSQGSVRRSQGAWVVSNLFCFDLAKDVALKDAR